MPELPNFAEAEPRKLGQAAAQGLQAALEAQNSAEAVPPKLGPAAAQAAELQVAAPRQSASKPVVWQLQQLCGKRSSSAWPAG